MGLRAGTGSTGSIGHCNIPKGGKHLVERGVGAIVLWRRACDELAGALVLPHALPLLVLLHGHLQR